MILDYAWPVSYALGWYVWKWTRSAQCVSVEFWFFSNQPSLGGEKNCFCTLFTLLLNCLWMLWQSKLYIEWKVTFIIYPCLLEAYICSVFLSFGLAHLLKFENFVLLATCVKLSIIGFIRLLSFKCVGSFWSYFVMSSFPPLPQS